MIATYSPARWFLLTKSLLLTITVAFISFIAATMVVVLREMAVGVLVYLAIVGLTVWRPRYGLYSVLFFTVLFEPYAPDPLMYPGWIIQSNISSWSIFNFVSFSPIELMMIITALSVLARAVVYQRWPRWMQLGWPIVIFMVLLTGSIAWGVANNGSLNIALWETRSLFLVGLFALLTPTLLDQRRYVAHLMNLILIAVILLSIEVIWRRFTLLKDVDALELAYDHETPILMNFAVLFLIARLVWPASGGQRLMALFIPLILYAEMLTERRAGWVCLDAGLVLIAIFVFRLRRKVFFYLVLPLLVIYAGYLVAFWNAEGAIAQPARAVRSINDPEGRDQSSNQYRLAERGNVRLNIRAHPLTGLGFGRQYVFYYNLPDLSANWPFYRYMAHVAVLWLWMKMGPLGFITFLTLIGAGIVRGVQLLKLASNDRDAPILVALLTGLMMLLIYSYIDLGLTDLRASVLLGFVLGVIGTWGRGAAAGERA